MATHRSHYNTVPSDVPDDGPHAPYISREGVYANEDIMKYGYVDGRAEYLNSTDLPDSSTENIMRPKAFAQSDSTNDLAFKGGAAGHGTSSKRPSHMRGSAGQIILACVLLLLPLALSAVLVYLIYANLQPRNDSAAPADTITEDGRNRSLSDNEYYVNYSATQLVFISSLSSTLALALVPVGMSLFSFATANTLQKASHSGQPQKLPTPYQFELSLRLLGGGQLDLYRYVSYLINRRRRKIATVPMLHHAAFMLGLMLLLAVCVTIVDALLHIKTATVQYNKTIPFLSTDFNPGRRLPSYCYNQTTTSPVACNIIPGGSGAKQSFKNSSEAYKVLGNTSDHNYIRLADDGKTAVITTPQSPPGVSFTAQSYASSTVCKPILSLCNPHYIPGGCDACQQWTYNCTAATAGAELSGQFNSFDLTTSSDGFNIYYYNTSSKSSNGTVSLTSAIDGNVWSAVLFILSNAEPNYTSSLDDGNIEYDPNLDLMADTYGRTYGILSCNTSLSDVTYYSAVDGSIRDPILSPMNDTASAPFVNAFTQQYGVTNVQIGLNLAGASAKSKEDLTHQVSQVLDRTFLGLSSGILPDRQAVSIYQEQSKQVAKVPIPEFIALIALNLTLPLLGIVLSAWAFVLCRKQGVVDVRARLGMGALVAGLFEDERLNATAESVDDLYAEMRGLPTSRVLARYEGQGNRMFVAVNDGVSQTKMDQELEEYRDVRQ